MNSAVERELSPALEFGWSQRAAARVAGLLARGGCSLEIDGLEHLPRESCLLCANHSSHADTFALAAALGPLSRRLVFLAARDYFSRLRSRGWLLRRLICLVPFDRGSGAGAMKHNLRVLGKCRDAGRIIVLFPEGTRSLDGQMQSFKRGAAIFADHLRLQVVPCRIEGSHAMLPKGRLIPRPAPLRVALGPALSLVPGAAKECAADRALRYGEFIQQLERGVAQLGRRSLPARSVAAK